MWQIIFLWGGNWIKHAVEQAAAKANALPFIGRFKMVFSRSSVKGVQLFPPVNGSCYLLPGPLL